MNTSELTTKLNTLFGALYDVSIEISLSNNVEVDLTLYPEEFHKYIEQYMGDQPSNSMAAAMAYLFDNNYLNANIKG